MILMLVRLISVCEREHSWRCGLAGFNKPLPKTFSYIVPKGGYGIFAQAESICCRGIVGYMLVVDYHSPDK